MQTIWSGIFQLNRWKCSAERVLGFHPVDKIAVESMAEEDPHLVVSHYEILGASDSAEYAEIRSKYREAILALHPDKQPANANGVHDSKALSSVASSDYSSGLWTVNIEENSISPNTVKSNFRELVVEDRFLEIPKLELNMTIISEERD
jgi:hypothetical protein